MPHLRSATSTRARRTALVSVAVAVTVLLACLAPPSSARATTASAPQPLVGAAASSLAKDVCSLLGKPVSVGVNQIIRWLTKGRIRGSFAGTLFNEIGFQRWCPGKADRLYSRIRGVSRRRPSLRSRLGPIVSNVVARYGSSADSRYRLLHVSWQEFTVSSRLRNHYVSYRLNNGGWRRMSRRSLLVRPGNFVRFAVRVDNYDGISSPWIYSLSYRV